MISGDHPTLLEWEIPLPCQPAKVHRLILGGFELSNAIEWARWEGSLAWLWACELCGEPGCSGRGVARFRRLEDQLFWMRAQAEDFPGDYGDTSFSINTQGIVARAAWDQIHRMGVAVPEFDSFHPLRRVDLGRLWLADMPQRVRTDDFNVLESLLRGELAASCPLAGEAAMARVLDLFEWFTDAPDDPVAGRIAHLDPPEGLHTFIFDRISYPDWPAFAASERWTLAFEGGFLHEFPSPP